MTRSYTAIGISATVLIFVAFWCAHALAGSRCYTSCGQGATGTSCYTTCS